MLSVGARLGQYEILASLGAGGMGEVWRARDTKLSRDVAIKVLPPELASDAGRLRRFEKEAQSASGLNHPNIVTIYDFGKTDSTSWIAMELVEGRTLRELLSTGPLALRRLFAMAAQLADGLARAHSAGIVHRDLKPENVMVTKDGLVKILDFGLAKLTHPEIEGGQPTEMPTVSLGTTPGIVMGTVGYMSPEQASGHPVDFRSDQFSFGSVLYEMATGKPAFRRGTTAQTLAAIIQDEPEAVGAVNPQAPVPLRWIVERCLSKDPEERYGTTRDLARDLASLRDHISDLSGSGAILAAPARSARRLWPAVAGITLLLAAAAIGWFAHRPRSTPPIYHRVTFRRGTIGGARFAPDGQTALYTAAWEGQDPQLFSTRLDNPQSSPLPLPSADLVSISSSGKMAIKLALEGALAPTNYAMQPPIGTLAEVPLLGGSPRELLEGVSDGDYAPDGTLAVLRTVGGRDRLEFPIGKVLYQAEPGGELLHPRVSPKGDGIAFFERGPDSVSVAFVDRAGKKNVLSRGWDVALALAWNPRTDEIWGTTIREGWELVAVSRSGRERVAARLPSLLVIKDIARDGRVLVSKAEYPIAMMCLPPGSAREVNLAWLEFSHSSDISNDGRTVLFWEFGTQVGSAGGIYLRNTDGSPAVRLGDGGDGSALSADKKWIVTGEADRIMFLPTGAGEPKTVRIEGMTFQAAKWFPDGKRVLFVGERQGTTGLFVQEVAGGSPRPLTPVGEIWPPTSFAISPDGRLVAARRPDGTVVLYPVDGGQLRVLSGIEPADRIVRWDERGEALYLARGEKSLRIDRYDVTSGRRELWKELMPSDPTGIASVGSLALTPDGKSYVYTIERLLSDLYVIEGLE